MILFYTVPTDTPPTRTPSTLAGWLRVIHDASTPDLRVRVALVVSVLILQASVVIHAAGEGTTVSEWVTPQTIIAVGSAVLAVGMMIQDLASLKRRVSDMDKLYATREAVQFQFQAVMSEIKTLRDDIERDDMKAQFTAFVQRFESYLQTVQTWSNRIESEIHSTQKDIVRLETKAAKGHP